LDGAKIDTTFNYPNTFFICFNLASDCGMERHILDQGVRGILYSHQTIDLYPVAIEKVLNGELWFPRIVLKEKLLAGSTPTTLPEITDTTLTMREKQVLNLLATGISNLEIANKLFLSTHTVKTHVYNIYRKIKVSNRLQAAVWMKNKQSNKISTSRNV
jgi:LuxR family transcriptional regulator of csgAB operon